MVNHLVKKLGFTGDGKVGMSTTNPLHDLQINTAPEIQLEEHLVVVLKDYHWVLKVMEHHLYRQNNLVDKLKFNYLEIMSFNFQW